MPKFTVHLCTSSHFTDVEIEAASPEEADSLVQAKFKADHTQFQWETYDPEFDPSLDYVSVTNERGDMVREGYL